ncbi:MAG: glycerophosphodiester phosphodiesterase [Candidatus Rokubacteria bacterium]|nr:glycerophosphodiester phosphodiesterase [Candidatus Rokubacteria bacterium]
MAARTRYAAHRGGAALWPENSLLAFRQALALGCDLLELDVHLTADGDVAVIHDRNLERTTEGSGPVSARTAAELARLRLRGLDGALTDERIPSFADVLGLVGAARSGLLVEIKGPGVGALWERRGATVGPVPGPRYEGLEDGVLGRLGAAGLAERASVMAFNPEVLARVRSRAPRQRTTLLVAGRHLWMTDARAEETIGWAVAAGATDLGLEYTLVDERLVRAAHAAGLGLGAWTVNDETAMRDLAGLGVDIITTDRPDLARRVLARAS